MIGKTCGRWGSNRLGRQIRASHGNVGFASFGEESFVPRIIDEDIPVIVHVDPNPIPEGKNVAVCG